MFSTEECIEILNHDMLELSEGVIVNCNTNTLEISSRQLVIDLNESQKRLLVCLIKKTYTKRDIINIVWYENHQRISDNNYHQLTFQLRALLHRNNLPANLLITVPYYGLKLNDNQWKTLAKAPIEEFTPVTPDAGIVSSDSDTAIENTVINMENAEHNNVVLSEKFIHSPYFSQSSIAQNAFILCMFVALIVFI